MDFIFGFVYRLGCVSWFCAAGLRVCGECCGADLLACGVFVGGVVFVTGFTVCLCALGWVGWLLGFLGWAVGWLGLAMRCGVVLRVFRAAFGF